MIVENVFDIYFVFGKGQIFVDKNATFSDARDKV